MTSMPYSHRAHANRRVTAASLDTDRTVASYQADHRTRSSISRPSRTQALQVAKRYASAIGLKAAKIALIDQLFAFSMAIDWSDAQT
ncbi:replication protein C, partial [Agrobacterium rhizogenes]|nr:replication protein C [Rhizobium rhizogenes]